MNEEMKRSIEHMADIAHNFALWEENRELKKRIKKLEGIIREIDQATGFGDVEILEILRKHGWEHG